MQLGRPDEITAVFYMAGPSQHSLHAPGSSSEPNTGKGSTFISFFQTREEVKEQTSFENFFYLRFLKEIKFFNGGLCFDKLQ